MLISAAMAAHHSKKTDVIYLDRTGSVRELYESFATFGSDRFVNRQ